MNSKFCRYSFGFLLLFLILFAFYFSNLALFIAAIFFIIIAMIEYRNMFKQKEIHIHKFLPEIIGVFIAYFFIFFDNISMHIFITPTILCGIILAFSTTIIKNRKPYLLTSFSTTASFLLIFCGLYIIKLTYFFKDINAWYMILTYLSTVLLGDFVASKIGPKFLKKLAPEISPNKTVGGAIANLITACITCLSLNILIGYPILYCLIFGIIISTFAQLGDLTISSFKRDLGIKHSGTMFLEYGGILDRMDAFIFSAPAAYYCLCLFS